MLLTDRTINDLPFTLKPERVEEIYYYVNKLNEFIPEGIIYLFGSFSKGRIKESSDIDLLVILPNRDLSARDRRDKRIDIMRFVDENCDIDRREVDVKIYGEIDYKEICTRPTFESSILKDLILLKGGD